MSGETPASARRATALIAAAWLLASVVYATHLYLFHTLRGQSTAFGHQLAEAFVHFVVWAMLTPVVLRISRAVPLRPTVRVRALVVHFAAAVLVASVQIVARAAIDGLLLHDLSPDVDLWRSLARLSARTFYANVIIYAVIVTGETLLAVHNERTSRALQLEARLADAQLDALRARLQPHFLFNSLNSIAALIPDEPSRAQEMVVRLSALLRAALVSDHRHEVPLAEELEIVRSYLEIERVRFEDRLQTRFEIAEDVAQAVVPALILQPLVENAIRHGVGNTRRGVTITIEAARHGEMLRMRVADDGRGLAEPYGEGVGTHATRRRLEQLYGSRQSLVIRDREGGGVEAIVELPCRF